MAQRWKVRSLAAAVTVLIALDGLAVMSIEDSRAAISGGTTAETAAAEGRKGERHLGQASDSEPVPGTTGDVQAAPDDAPRPTRAETPRPGSYTWRTRSEGVSTYSSTTKQEEGESEETYRYEVVAEPDRLRVRRHSDYQESQDGDFTMGGSSYSDQKWGPDGIYQLGGRVDSKGQSSDGHTEEWTNGCDWSPPVPELVYPLTEGTAWEWSSTCEQDMDRGNMTNRQTWTGTGQIEGWEAVEIGGERALAVRIRVSSQRVSQSEFRGQVPDGNQPDGVVFASETVSWFAPALGLEVRSESKTDVSRPDGDESDDFRSRRESTTELVSLHPRVGP